MTINKQLFIKNKTKNIYTYTLKNQKNTQVIISELGAAIIDFSIVDEKNKRINTVLNYKDPNDYLKNDSNLGVVIGRNCNRIKNSKVEINNKTYYLEKNEDNNNLHTGINGLQHKIFESFIVDNKLVLKTKVFHLEDGLPGNLDVKITYSLDENNLLLIDYDIVSDKDTIINVTNHSYFNLGAKNILDCHLKVNANYYMPTINKIPTKEILNVKNTPFDFLSYTKIKDNLKFYNLQIKNSDGIDHNFLLNSNQYQKVAALYNKDSHIKLDVYTDLSNLQIYTGNHFTENDFNEFGGIAFETQMAPNTPSMPWLKTSITKHFKSKTGYKLSIKKHLSRC